MKQNGEIFNTEMLKFDAAETIEMSYYNEKPDITGDGGKGGGNGDAVINWVNFLTGKSGSSAMGAYEFIYLHIWLSEKEFGLSENDELAIWRITIINGEYIVHAEKLTNAHGFLPLIAGRPWSDNFNNQTQSFA